MNYFYIALTQLAVLCVYEAGRYCFWRYMQAVRLRRLEQMDLGVQNLIQALKQNDEKLPKA